MRTCQNTYLCSECVAQKVFPNHTVDTSQLPCYCDHACIRLDDCCSDYKHFCAGKSLFLHILSWLSANEYNWSQVDKVSWSQPINLHLIFEKSSLTNLIFGLFQIQFYCLCSLHVRFLGKVTARQFCFEINWPLERCDEKWGNEKTILY